MVHVLPHYLMDLEGCTGVPVNYNIKANKVLNESEHQSWHASAMTVVFESVEIEYTGACIVL